MKQHILLLAAAAALLCACTAPAPTVEIPLPEHPRPDFERTEWINLNGYWDFTFDEAIAQQGIETCTSSGFDRRILVPFPWSSKLSEVSDDGDIAWYARKVTVPKSWEGKRVFVVVGASDWQTDAWFDGKALGSHEGGYTPFEFELTDGVEFGKEQLLAFRVDDVSNDAHPYGKQGYGNARGIWQTVYLEARGENHIKSIHFTPDIDNSKVNVNIKLAAKASPDEQIQIKFADPAQTIYVTQVMGDSSVFDLDIKDQHLWDLDDPYLYEVTATLFKDAKPEDEVHTYFGQRKISTMPLPGQTYNYIALNNKPVYMQLCLDQSYHPDGFYTFPTDEFMKNEILLSKKLGLTGNRIHIKVEVPRKLYWADKLGLLIMADVPNFWGEPDAEARANWESCMRGEVERDYNHPSIFAWVDFNETWGLFSEGHVYTKETQEWVRDMYHLTKSLDASRLVEDNSACNNDHVETDINSWHGYHRGFVWDEVISEFDKGAFPGSTHNYIGGNKQGDEPMMNSECGNVWGYEGNTGDCDYTWDYHIMMDAFRRHPKCAGWLYTEHHDVINEWNGYVKFDRSEKIFGFSDIVPGMDISDFHSPYYIEADKYLVTRPSAGQTVNVPVYASFMTDKDPGKLTLETRLVGWNNLGEKAEYESFSMDIPFEAYLSRNVGNIAVRIPEYKGLYVLQMVLKDGKGEALHHNFTTFKVDSGKNAEGILIPFAPASFTASEWASGQSQVLGGLKVNGFDFGYFEYTVNLPKDIDPARIASAKLVFEAGSKQRFGKDINDGRSSDGDYMLGGGTFDRCKTRNAYAITDNECWKSLVVVSVNGKEAGAFNLDDDPADQRGLLSWCSQPNEKFLHEGGSYGQLITAEIPVDAITRTMKVRFTVPDNFNGGRSGLAIYGKDFGRYPLDPTIVLTLK